MTGQPAYTDADVITVADALRDWDDDHSGHKTQAEAVLDAVAADVAARAWDEAAEAVADWMSINPGPSGIPHDPPANPYAKDGT